MDTSIEPILGTFCKLRVLAPSSSSTNPNLQAPCCPFADPHPRPSQLSLDESPFSHRPLRSSDLGFAQASREAFGAHGSVKAALKEIPRGIFKNQVRRSTTERLKAPLSQTNLPMPSVAGTVLFVPVANGRRSQVQPLMISSPPRQLLFGVESSKNPWISQERQQEDGKARS
ncbi:hypothetical protein U1Q18_039183 [Sarracenia purpurea var. burkii]